MYNAPTLVYKELLDTRIIITRSEQGKDRQVRLTYITAILVQHKYNSYECMDSTYMTVITKNFKKLDGPYLAAESVEQYVELEKPSYTLIIMTACRWEGWRPFKIKTLRWKVGKWPSPKQKSILTRRTSRRVGCNMRWCLGCKCCGYF